MFFLHLFTYKRKNFSSSSSGDAWDNRKRGDFLWCGILRWGVVLSLISRPPSVPFLLTELLLLLTHSVDITLWASLVAQMVKCLPTMRETRVQSLGREDLLEKAMAPHSSTLAWKIPWTEEPGRLQSMGLQRVGHDWATSLSLFTFMHWRKKWQPTPVLLPGATGGLTPFRAHSGLQEIPIATQKDSRVLCFPLR